MVRKLVIVVASIAAVGAVSVPAASASTGHGVTPSACIGRYPVCTPGGGY